VLASLYSLVGFVCSGKRISFWLILNTSARSGSLRRYSRALTYWVINKRAIDIKLDLAFFPVLWQFSPTDTGAARSYIIAT
jgi:hypothetical protein